MAGATGCKADSSENEFTISHLGGDALQWACSYSFVSFLFVLIPNFSHFDILTDQGPHSFHLGPSDAYFPSFRFSFFLVFGLLLQHFISRLQPLSTRDFDTKP